MALVFEEFNKAHTRKARYDLLKQTRFIHTYRSRLWAGIMATLMMYSDPLQLRVCIEGQDPSTDEPVQTAHRHGSLNLILVTVKGGVFSDAAQDDFPTVLGEFVHWEILNRMREEKNEFLTAHFYWLHFDFLEDLIKALQGYGGFHINGCISYGGGSPLASIGTPSDLKPISWTDGEQDIEHDLLEKLPYEGDAQAQRKYLLRSQDTQ
eukprot:COSAG02_NODE_348_length_24081_cov_19.231007_19_plen_208_part_00